MIPDLIVEFYNLPKTLDNPNKKRNKNIRTEIWACPILIKIANISPKNKIYLYEYPIFVNDQIDILLLGFQRGFTGPHTYYSLLLIDI